MLAVLLSTVRFVGLGSGISTIYIMGSKLLDLYYGSFRYLHLIRKFLRP